jgi:hypothetical protein
MGDRTSAEQGQISRRQGTGKCELPADNPFTEGEKGIYSAYTL